MPRFRRMQKVFNKNKDARKTSKVQPQPEGVRKSVGERDASRPRGLSSPRSFSIPSRKSSTTASTSKKKKSRGTGTSLDSLIRNKILAKQLAKAPNAQNRRDTRQSTQTDSSDQQQKRVTLQMEATLPEYLPVSLAGIRPLKPLGDLEDEKDKAQAKARRKSAGASDSNKSSLARLLTKANVRHDEMKYVYDPVAAFKETAAIRHDQLEDFIKIAVCAMMLLATMLWGLYFYWHGHIPRLIFAYREIGKIFSPQYSWSHIWMTVASPFLAGIYCLIMAVYSDAREWSICCKPRIKWRWVPYFGLLLNMMLITCYWFYQLCFIPGSTQSRMINELRTFERNWQQTGLAADLFPIQFVYIHNYYQCCGIDTRLDWTGHYIPLEDHPYPFKSTPCIKIKYGEKNNDTEAKLNCPANITGDISSLGIRWPASCCNNESKDCLDLPTNTDVWRGHCLNSEIMFAMLVVLFAIFLSITIIVIGIVVFYKIRLMETFALRTRRRVPKPHF